MMNLIIQVGKRRAIYIPKKVAEKLQIKEGDKLLLYIRGDEIRLKPLKKYSVKAWSEISPKEVESVGEEISQDILS